LPNNTPESSNRRPRRYFPARTPTKTSSRPGSANCAVACDWPSWLG